MAACWLFPRALVLTKDFSGTAEATQGASMAAGPVLNGGGRVVARLSLLLV